MYTWLHVEIIKNCLGKNSNVTRDQRRVFNISTSVAIQNMQSQNRQNHIQRTLFSILSIGSRCYQPQVVTNDKSSVGQ